MEKTGGSTPGGGSQTVLDKDWLELASIKEDGTRYVVNTTYAGEKRNYTVFYDTEMMAPLWTAYPLNNSHMSSGRIVCGIKSYLTYLEKNSQMRSQVGM